MQGLILADNKTRTNVIVEEVVSGGNAEKSGKVQVGDIVSRYALCACQDLGILQCIVQTQD